MLFVWHRVPHKPFADSQVISEVLKDTFERTKLIPPTRYVGSDILRHSLATNMLRRGASLADIGEVLRHRARRSTMIYAKLDVEGLRSVAQDWPVVAFIWSRLMAHKQILFHSAAREKVLRGATLLADAVRVTLGPKSKSVFDSKELGPADRLQ